jgi:hypothetical protein
MSGYIHTCEKCGTHMQVHERYLGRTLKCTSCRTEFEAKLPEDGIGDGPILAEIEEEVEKSRKKKFPIWLIFIFVPIVALIWFLGQDQGDGPASSVFREERSAGENATVDAGTGRPVLTALDHEAVAALQTIGQGSVQINVSALMDQNKYLELPAGTNVRVLEFADGGRTARIRILEGPWQSRIVWIPARWIR